MAKTKKAKEVQDSYTINGTNEIVSPGDCVLMKAAGSDNQPYVARVHKFEADDEKNINVRVQWYYRPEDTILGRRLFHGVKELFLSDHHDIQSARSIERKCSVHSLNKYQKLDGVGPEDYFSRYQYSVANGVVTPKSTTVYCKCEMPYNPDDLMVLCEGCEDWYHPSCVGLTIEDAKNLDNFFCSECSHDDAKFKKDDT